jgi:predicted small lipoprotein YifL
VTTLRRAPAVVLALPLAALAGCGDDKPVSLPKGDKPAARSTLVYKGSSSQRQSLRIQADDRLVARLKLLLRCKDGGETEATLATEPRRPTLQADGSFYYSETGRVTFRGFGPGRYRAAMAGQLAGESGDGHASFRISFKSTSCRSNVSWRARRQ